jgi:hypothetical protein
VTVAQQIVIPAKAGIHFDFLIRVREQDQYGSRFRGDDGILKLCLGQQQPRLPPFL